MNLEKCLRFLHHLRLHAQLRLLPRRHGRPELHHPSELFAAIIVNLIALVIKFGDRTQLGATHLATSLVATPATAGRFAGLALDGAVAGPADGPAAMSVIVSMSGGALLANLVSVTLLIGETLRQGR